MDNTRNTKQKQVILNILKQSNKPMSINEIYEGVRASLPTIAKSTIYRNIDSLIKQDLIDKYYLSDNELFYKIKTTKSEHKHYIICDQCKRMFDLPHCPIHEIEETLSKDGFMITDHYIQIFGRCKDCQEKLKQKNETLTQNETLDNKMNL